MDMGSGLVILGGSDGYTVLNPELSGLYINGNAKSVAILVHAETGKKTLIAGVNNGALQSFSIKD